MQSIPTELLLVIFRYLKRKNQKECMKVCKSWYTLVLPLYFEEIAFNATTIQLVKHQLTLPTRNYYFKNGSFTKKLIIRLDNSSSDETKSSLDTFKFTSGELFQLFSYMSNLVTFDATSSHYFLYYMECLANKQVGARLEQIPCDMHEGSFLINLAACYNYRNSITWLKTVYNIQNDTRFIQLLSGFKKLTHLDVYNESVGSQLSPLDIHRVCPNLVQFKFYMEDFFVDQVLLDNSISKYTKNIKKLELCIPDLSRSYVHYITSFAPHHLDTLGIHLQRVDLRHCISQLGIDTMLYLAHYLSQIKCSRITFCHPVTEYEGESNGLKMTQFYKVLNEMKGNRAMYCTATFDDFYPNETEIKVKDNDRLYFKYGLDYEDYFYNEDSYSSQLFLPDKQNSVLGPDMIHDLNFTIRLENEETLCHILKYALTQCPHLQKFTLENNNCQIFGSPRQQMDYPTTMSIHDTIKKIKFAGMTLSKNLIDLVSNHLPEVEEIVSELGDEYYNNFSNTKNMNMVIDMTQLKHLTCFYLDIRTMVNTNLFFHHLFIHLKYSDKHDLYFSIQRSGNQYNFSPVTLAFVQEAKCLSICMISIKCHAIQDIILTCGNKNKIIAKIQCGTFGLTK